MKKVSTIIILILTIFLIISLTACNTNDDNDDEQDPTIAKMEVFQDNSNNDKSILRGSVKDVNYNTLNGIELFFGEDENLAASTDENGEFLFYFKDPHNYAADRVIDFLVLDFSIYKFKVILQEMQHTSNNNIDIRVLIIVDDFDSDFDIYSLVILDYFMKCTFHNDNVVLPAGYVSRGYTFVDGGLSANGDHTLTGVKLYANGNLIAESNDFGFLLDFIIPGTSLRFEKVGFTFIHRSGSVFTPLENDTYIFTGFEVGMIEFRGHTENLNILVD